MTETPDSSPDSRSGKPVIEVRDLWKSFGEQEVLRGVDLTVLEGETMVVLGASGCGKSVLLKHVIGLLKPDRGSIVVEGHEVTELSARELKRLRMCFGMVFQGAALFDSMTVGENVGLPLKEHRGMRGRRAGRPRGDEAAHGGPGGRLAPMAVRRSPAA